MRLSIIPTTLLAAFGCGPSSTPSLPEPPPASVPAVHDTFADAAFLSVESQQVTAYAWTPSRSSFAAVELHDADSRSESNCIALSDPEWSRISFTFPAAFFDNAVLEIVHGVDAPPDCPPWQWPAVQVRINDSVLAESLRPAAAAGGLNRFEISKYLQPGQNTIRLRPLGGKGEYLLQSLRVRIADSAAALIPTDPGSPFPPEDATVLRVFFEDGRQAGDMEVATDYLNKDAQCGRFRFFAKERSTLKATCNVPDPAGTATLLLHHLSSMVLGEPLNGQSPVSIDLNGIPVATSLDAGAHSATPDRIDVSAFVRRGKNTITISLAEGASAQYELLAMSLVLAR
ncbi:MAG: hypothetical protein HY520_01585 [Candidatus Aenigmarchaeota archaeon]|nr:hypothetical protein [Candidatus Aenigmarchaeota archaeon]